GAPVLERAGATLVAAGAAVEPLPELQAAISSAALRPAADRPDLFVREDKNVPRVSLPSPGSHGGTGPAGRASLSTLAIGEQAVPGES
ncbi:hypothetical protein CRM92_10675, partial [Rothia dentocariosa]